MFPCNVCTNTLTSPVCLPCGHLFCNDCIIRVIRAIAPLTTLHYCPSCQAPYSTDTLDGATVPAHLRVHLLPSVRKLKINSPETVAEVPSSSTSEQAEIARLRAENAALQKNSAMWRKRAEAHSSSTLGLLQLVRITRDQAMEVVRQRDELRRRCEALQQQLDNEQDEGDEDEYVSTFPPWLSTGEEPFLPVNMLDRINNLSKSNSPASMEHSSAESGLGSRGVKRIRTPYDSPNESDEEVDREPRSKRQRSTAAALSPLMVPSLNFA